MADDTPSTNLSDPDPVGRAERLRQSADEAARLSRTLLVTFVLIGVYIGITIFSTTDVQLVKETPVQLPIFDVDLPLVWFFAVVPWAFLLVHVNVLLQLYQMHASRVVARDCRFVGDIARSPASDHGCWHWRHRGR